MNLRLFFFQIQSLGSPPKNHIVQFHLFHRSTIDGQIGWRRQNQIFKFYVFLVTSQMHVYLFVTWFHYETLAGILLLHLHEYECAECKIAEATPGTFNGIEFT